MYGLLAGRRRWEIGAADETGARLAKRITYRPADDMVWYVEEGSVPDPFSEALTVFRRSDHGYDDKRNPSREALSAGGTTHTLVQRTFDGQGRLECEARRMNPVAFGALGDSAACTPGPEGSYGPDRITPTSTMIQ